MRRLEENFKQSGGKWQEFRIGDLFDVDNLWIYGKNKQYETKFKDNTINSIPVISGITANNGVNYWTKDVLKDSEIFKDSLTISTRGEYSGTVTYHTGIFALANNILVMQMPNWSFESKLYIGTLIQKLGYGGFNNYPRKETLKDDIISLPVLPSCNENKFEIAFEYMESYIKELEAERLEELEAYLLATGLKDYKLTEQEKVILQDFAKLQDENSKRGEAFSSLEDYLLYGGSLLDSKKQNFITHALSCLTQRALKSLDTSKWAEFRIGDLFSISTPKKKFDANKIQFGGIYPYVARGETNNGIRGYITQDTSFLNPANTISFGQDTATMFYQDKPYFTGDKIKIFSLKVAMLNRHRANFLIASMRKSFSTFSWGSTSFSVGNLQEVKVLLPVLPSPVIATAKPEAMQNRKNIDSHENSQEFSRNDKYNIDFAFMESFIKEIEKEHFLSLIEYYHKEMSAYNEVLDSSLATINGGGH